MRSLALAAAYAAVANAAPGGPPGWHWQKHDHPGWNRPQVYTPEGPPGPVWTPQPPYGPGSSSVPSITASATLSASASSSATPTSSSASSVDACASVSELAKSQTNADPSATPTVPAGLAWDCITSVPFKSKIAGKIPEDASKRLAPTLAVASFAAAMSHFDNRSKARTEQNPEFAGIPDDFFVSIYQRQDEWDAQADAWLDAECKISSLIGQGLLNGYLSHKQRRFAILGAKQKAAVQAGFPAVWRKLTADMTAEVPGWRRDAISNPSGGGRVVHLQNARPVGAGP